MWSQHGFWNNLEQPGAGGGAGAGYPGGPYYPGYDQDLPSYYKHFGYDAVLAGLPSTSDTEAISRGQS